MALYNELPVYKICYEMFIDIYKFVKTFTKEYKYTIGEKLKNETLDLIMNIYRANIRTDKLVLIQNARENVEVIRLLIRLLKDLQQIGLERFVQVNLKIENISKQLAGWQKSQSLNLL